MVVSFLYECVTASQGIYGGAQLEYGCEPHCDSATGCSESNMLQRDPWPYLDQARPQGVSAVREKCSVCAAILISSS